MTRKTDRRNFLKWSAASLTALGVGMPSVFQRARLLAGASGSPTKKILYIFLRGGIDGVQAIIPYGDQGLGPDKPDYLTARPTIAAQPGDAHDLNGFCSFFPSMQSPAANGPKLADIFHNNIDGRGDSLAVVGRVGYQNQDRSHFSSQKFYENCCPGDVGKEEGVFNRYISAYTNPESPLQGATMNGSQMVFMKGDLLLPVLRSVDDYQLPTNVNLGSVPTRQNPKGSGLMGAYGQSGFDIDRAWEQLTYSTGGTLLDGLQFFEDNVHGTTYSPEAAAQPYYDAIGDNGFRNFLRDSARLLKQVDSLQVVGCNQNGYDTHGSEHLRFPGLVEDLGLAFTALYHDLEPIWNDTIVVCMSEFGRTSLENGNRGTDHAESTFMMLMGGPINGGVYNIDSATWANGDMFSTANGRYVAHRTDYRNIYNEILSSHLGDPSGLMDDIIPGYSGLVANDTQGYFTPLGLVQA
jgi:uncharacterized protein (DUF1501 family)